MVRPGPRRRNPEQVLQLIEHQQHRGPQREPHNHRVRHVLRQIPQPQQRNPRLNRPHQQRQQKHRRQPLRIREPHERTQHRNRNRIRRPIDELLRRIEQRPDRRHHDRRVQPILRRKIRDLRISHRLRHRDRRHGQPRHRVARQVVPRIAAQRIKRRHDAKQSFRQRRPIGAGNIGRSSIAHS